MPHITHDAEIYAQELSHRGHGRPMWSPEIPANGVKLGDVGLILKERGAFFLLFNVLAGEQERNKNGVPLGFTPLKIHEALNFHQEDFIQNGFIGSTSVKSKKGDAAATGGLPVVGGGVSYTYNQNAERGALLYITDSADTDAILPNKVCARYMDQHYDSWCRFAERLCYELDARKMEGPILINGIARTSGWAVAAWSFRTCNQEVTVQFNALETADAAVSFSFSNECWATPAHRSGPKRDPRKANKRNKDQTVFLDRYQLKRRNLFFVQSTTITTKGEESPYREIHFIGPRNSASQGSQGDSGSQGEGDQLATDNHNERPIDPVEKLLDYILEHSEADRAIACEGDLRDVLGIGPDEEFPGDIKTELERISPIIDTFGNNAATLSIEDIVFRSHASRGQGSTTTMDTGRQPSSAVADDDSGTLTIGTTVVARRTIRWPHTSFVEHGVDTGVPCNPAISSDGRLLAAGYEDTIVRLFDMNKGLLSSTYTDQEDTIRCVAFSPDSSFLVSGSARGSIIVWNIQSGAMFKSLEGLESDISSLAISPDGEDIVAGSTDSTIGFWKLGGEGNTRPFAKVEGNLMAVQDVVYTPNGSHLVSYEGDIGQVCSRDGTPVSQMKGHERPIHSLDVSRGKQDHRAVTGSEDHTARVWKVETGEELVTIRYHQKSVSSARFISEDKRIVCGSYDTTISIHDSYSGELYSVLTGHVSFVESVAYFPRGGIIASGARDGIVLLWDAKTGEQIAELNCHFDRVTSIQVLPDNEHIITCSDDGTIRALNVVDVVRVS